jgi:hypothetical protein
MTADVVAERTLLEVVRVAFADIRRLVDSKGNPIPLQLLDDDTGWIRQTPLEVISRSCLGTAIHPAVSDRPLPFISGLKVTVLGSVRAKPNGLSYSTINVPALSSARSWE